MSLSLNDVRDRLRSFQSLEEISDLFSFDIGRCKKCVERSSGNQLSSLNLYDGSGDLSCCEYGLIKQLVDKHIAPSTPLHPKCFPWVSVKGSNLTVDKSGCFDDAQIRSRTDRARFRDRPRLFQLHVASHKKQLNGASNRRLGSKRKKNEQEEHITVDVTALSFKDPWGWPLGVSCSEQMRKADELLVKSIVLSCEHNPHSDSIRCYLSMDAFVKNDLEYLKHVNVDCFESESDQAFVSLLCRQVLKVMFLASRGKFMSNNARENLQHFWPTPQILSGGLTGQKCPTELIDLLNANDDIISKSYLDRVCTPWLPFDQYFSLSMFFASRFEVSLRKKLKSCSKHLSHCESIKSSLSKIPQISRMQILKDSVGKSYSEMLRHDCAIFQANLIRELHSPKVIEDFTNISTLSLCTPITELESIRALFLRRTSLIILDNIASFNATYVKELDWTNPLRRSVPVKKKSKRKKKKRKDAKQNKDKSRPSNTPISNDKENTKAQLNLPSQVSPVCVPGQKRNRSIISALSMIDIILERVFSELGFNENEHKETYSFDSDSGPIKSFNDLNQRESDENHSNEINFIFTSNQETVKHRNSIQTSLSGGSILNMDFTCVEMSLDSSGAFEDWSAVIGLEKQRSWLLDLLEDKQQSVRASSTAASIASTSDEGINSEIDNKSFSEIGSSALSTKLDMTVNDDEVDIPNDIENHSDLHISPTRNAFFETSSPLNEGLDNVRSYTPPPLSVSTSPQYVTLADIGELRKTCSVKSCTKNRPGSAPSSPILFYKSEKISHSQKNLQLLLRNEIKTRSKHSNDFDPSPKDTKDLTENESISKVVEDENKSGHYFTKGKRSPVPSSVVLQDDKHGTHFDPLSQGSHKEMISVEDERNIYQDLCLTLSAEVSKLRNQLASLTHTESPSPFCISNLSKDSMYPDFPPFDCMGEGVTRSVVGPMTIAGPMSIAGFSHRDHESEDGDHIQNTTGDNSSTCLNVAGQCSESSVLRPSKGAMSESDILSDHEFGFSTLCNTLRQGQDPFGIGTQSRLSRDIYKFVYATSEKLKTTEKARKMAVTRIWKVVTNLWPRAQVKLYGSHTCNLSIPSSDLDFVVCLPAVRKKTPAVAPGVLEGRNAINEPFQKILARKLKGESWLEPRSIKIIDHTAVPVIKVSTKDRRDKVIKLDISFASSEHHGLQAIHMVKSIMEEFPMVRPLVLVLKQFLQDRGLLTPYTGGLSSYCLFLLVSRYLQEQSTSLWCDCGSLLMGFLDFYGNSFDPRSTGVSVKCRRYFPRQSEQSSLILRGTQISIPSQTHQNTLNFNQNLARRHSFNENDTRTAIESTGSSTRINQKAKFTQAQTKTSASSLLNNISKNQKEKQPAVKPYSFDPLFVEDPLSESNNVGRNAFRIFQIKRAFSGAHRALLAALEWEISESTDGEYPLLKSLLLNEDVVFY